MSETLSGKISVLSGWSFPSTGFNKLEGTPLLRIRDLGKNTPEINFRGNYDAAYLIYKDDILIGMDGDFVVEKWGGAPALLNQRVCKVQSISDDLDQNFLYWYLKPHIENIHRKTPQTTVRHLSASTISEVPAPSLSIFEQRKVHGIIEALDTTLRQTEAIIEKLKQVKQGLLHDLLTRGIDANGELRPPQSEAPELYKESALGWIPREWSIFGLAQIAPNSRSVIRTGPFGSSLKGEHWREGGRPVITIGSLGDGFFVKNELLFIDESTATRLSDFELVPGDIVFSRVADVGRSVVVTKNETGWIMSSNFMRISVDSEKVRPYFLQLLLASSALVRKQIRSAVNSGGRDVANSAVLMSLVFPWPIAKEQDKIIEKVRSLDKRIKAEEELLLKQIINKSGLMDDLLTGRVRVTPLLESATA